jgi:hypothetical protein
VSGIFHEDSEFCILPTKNINKSRRITKDEYMTAQEIVGKYQKQKKEAESGVVGETGEAIVLENGGISN